jgi:hypothetical protein
MLNEKLLYMTVGGDARLKFSHPDLNLTSKTWTAVDCETTLVAVKVKVKVVPTISGCEY